MTHPQSRISAGVYTCPGPFVQGSPLCCHRLSTCMGLPGGGKPHLPSWTLSPGCSSHYSGSNSALNLYSTCPLSAEEPGQGCCSRLASLKASPLRDIQPSIHHLAHRGSVRGQAYEAPGMRPEKGQKTCPMVAAPQAGPPGKAGMGSNFGATSSICLASRRGVQNFFFFK